MISFIPPLCVACPEYIILLTACIALLADLFFSKTCKKAALWITLFGLLSATIISAYSLPVTGESFAFHGLFVIDQSTQLMKMFICLSIFLSYCYSITYLEARAVPMADYLVLGLFSTLGMMTIVSSGSLLTMYLGLELMSLPIYAMIGILKTSKLAAEAAMKYFVMGSLASGILLYGFSFIYGVTGYLDLVAIADAIVNHTQYAHITLVFGLVFILVGVAFKLAAVPFHMWAPDIYEGSPNCVALFISAAPKIAMIGFMLRLMVHVFPALVQDWQQIILVLALLSTAIGNLLAVVQYNIKRLLAYSAIAHIGYALFGLATAHASGYSATLYYILIYALMTIPAFGLIVLLSQHGVEIQSLDDFKGLNKRNPWLAFLLMIVLFSLAGVPPTVGFFNKLWILKVLVAEHMTWAAIYGLLFSIIGAYYYIRIIKIMYFDEPIIQQPVIIPMITQGLFSAHCLALLYLGFLPAMLMAACMQAYTT